MCEILHEQDGRLEESLLPKFRELYEKQFGKAATVAALQRGRELKAKRADKKPPDADVPDQQRLQKLREERRKRREGKNPTS